MNTHSAAQRLCLLRDAHGETVRLEFNTLQSVYSAVLNCVYVRVGGMGNATCFFCGATESIDTQTQFEHASNCSGVSMYLQLIKILATRTPGRV